MGNEKQLWKKIFIDKSVFKIPEGVNFIKEGYLEHDTIHIQIYGSETLQIRIKIVSFDVSSFEMLKAHVSSQVEIENTIIGNNEGFIAEGEYDFIKEFYYPDYNGNNNVCLTIHSSEDTFYGLNYQEFIVKMTEL